MAIRASPACAAERSGSIARALRRRRSASFWSSGRGRRPGRSGLALGGLVEQETQAVSEAARQAVDRVRARQEGEDRHAAPLVAFELLPDAAVLRLQVEPL